MSQPQMKFEGDPVQALAIKVSGSPDSAVEGPLKLGQRVAFLVIGIVDSVTHKVNADEDLVRTHGVKVTRLVQATIDDYDTALRRLEETRGISRLYDAS